VKGAACVLGPELAEAQVEQSAVDSVLERVERGDRLGQLRMSDVDLDQEPRRAVADADSKLDGVVVGPDPRDVETIFHASEPRVR